MKYAYIDLVVIPKSVLDRAFNSNKELTVILQQTKPLLPIVENAFDAGVRKCSDDKGGIHSILSGGSETKKEFLEKEIEL